MHTDLERNLYSVTPLPRHLEGGSREEVGEMRRLVLVVASTIIAALMVGSPVSAESYEEFTDRVGDLSPCPMYDLYAGNGDGMSEEGHPVCGADYLDLVGGRVTLNDDGTYLLELEVAGEVSEETVLPEGTKGVLWVWYLYESKDYYANAMAVVAWDGEEFQAYVKHRTEFGAVPYPYWELEFVPDGCHVRLEIGADDTGALDLVSGMNYWFAETKAWFSTLIEPDEEWAYQPTYGGWFCVDINDFYPAETLIPPLLDMPT
jgi:hypothetical protein